MSTTNQSFKPFSLRIKGENMTFSQPLVMGILNVTPDSFYAGSRCDSSEKIDAKVQRLLAENADIIDVGGYSSRPNASDVAPAEEFARLKAGIEAVHRHNPNAIISIDTFRADVARRCVEELGADIINDVSGGILDSDMFATVAKLRVPYVLMHMRGNFSTMQSLTDYTDVTTEVIDYLAQKISTLRDLGATDVIADPGFGFSKTLDQNYEMMNRLELFHSLNVPLLVGISRKSMIYKLLGCTPAEALNATAVLNTISLAKGAHILRVHDVKAAVEARTIVMKTLSSTNK